MLNRIILNSLLLLSCSLHPLFAQEKPQLQGGQRISNAILKKQQGQHYHQSDTYSKHAGVEFPYFDGFETPDNVRAQYDIYQLGTDSGWGTFIYDRYEGSLSLGCASGGSSTSTGSYFDNQDSWIVLGPMDLSGYDSAVMSFHVKYETESGYDEFHYLASKNGTDFHGYSLSGNSDGWESKSLDLSDVPTLGNITRESEVWVAFRFTSDYSISYYDGARVDALEIITGAGDPAPDLMPQISYVDRYWTTATNTQVVLTSTNAGELDAAPSLADIYLSTDNELDGSDILLAGDIAIASISSGASLTDTIPVSIPDLEGEYYLIAILDPDDTQQERSEVNNQAASHKPVIIRTNQDLPDIVPEFLLTENSFWIAGTEVQAEFSLQNTGFSGTGTFNTALYLSQEGRIDTSDVLLLEYTLTELSGIGSEHITVNVTVPDVLPGTYYFGLIADVDRTVEERYEDNNILRLAGPVKIIAKGEEEADLKIANMSLPEGSDYAPGDSISVAYTIYNQGGLTATAFLSQLYLSDNDAITPGDSLLGPTHFIDSLPSGEAITIVKKYVLPGRAGSYFLGAITDLSDTVPESSETNNIYVLGSIGLLNEAQEQYPDISLSTDRLTINQSTDAQYYGTEGKNGKESGILADFVPNRLIIRFKGSSDESLLTKNTGSASLDALNKKYNLQPVNPLSKPQHTKKGVGTFVTTYSGPFDMEAVLAAYRNNPWVAFAEPDYLVTKDVVKPMRASSDDPFYAEQWGLKNTGNASSYYGTSIGTAGEDINIEPAWDISMGLEDIVVAVIDDGLQMDHPEFSGRVIKPWDFVDNDDDPSPGTGDFHGTAVAGIIAAANDGSGMVGVAPGVKIMPLRVFNGNSTSTSSIIETVYYAVDNGADIINMSFGGGSYNQAFADALQYAHENGVVVMASAGNSGINNSELNHYPSSYPHTLSIGALSPCGGIKDFYSCDRESFWGSNYGNLDFLTPGVRIHTTTVNSGFMDDFNGTSSAAPFAAGVAALVLSVNPDLDPASVRGIMQRASVDFGKPGYDEESGFGRLDAHKALILARSFAPNTLFVNNTGLTELIVTELETDQPWLSFETTAFPLTIAPGQGEQLRAQVDWTQISNQSTARVTLRSNDPDETSVSFVVTVNPEGTELYEIAATVDSAQTGYVYGAGAYAQGEEVVLRAVANEHFQFHGWFENDSLISTEPELRFAVTAARSLTADIRPTLFTLSLPANTNETGRVSGEGQYTYGELAFLSVLNGTTRPYFVNWSIGDKKFSDEWYPVIVIDEDKTITANFSNYYYEISSEWYGDKGTITGRGLYYPGQTAVLTAIPSEHYEFLGWHTSYKNLGNNPTYTFVVKENVFIRANFVPRKYTVTTAVNDPARGEARGTGIYPYKETVYLQAIPASGYVFTHWVEEDRILSTNPEFSFSSDGNHSIEAVFNESEVTVTLESSPAAGGSLTGAGTYPNGTEVTVNATENYSYRFLHWQKDGEIISQEENYTFTATEPTLLTAVFDQPVITIATTVEAEGTASISGDGAHAYKDTVTITATPEEGYSFVSWQENGEVVSEDSTLSFVATTDRSLVAHTEQKYYEISVTAFPRVGGSVTGGSVFPHGATVTVQASATEGYVFLNWTEGGELISEETEFSFAAIADLDLIANFESVLAVEELPEGLLIYPNPAKRVLIIDWLDFDKAELLDLNGKTLLTSQDNRIDLQHISPGTYLLRIWSQDGKNYHSKILKQ